MRTDPSPEYIVGVTHSPADPVNSGQWLNAVPGISAPHRQQADTAGRPIASVAIASEPGDTLDLSPEAVAAAEAGNAGKERIIAIRQAIAQGEYESEGKLIIAIARLLTELTREVPSSDDA